MDQQILVVVGNGMVGYRLCRQLVDCGAAGGALRVVVFGEEPRPAYDRIRLTEMLAGKTEDDLTLAPRAWYEEHGIELFLGDPVVALDREECAVRAASGRQVLFDRVVLATGSRPFVPPIPGADLPGVLVYRTVDDVQALRDRARDAGRVAVIGGGLLGLEAARAILDLGLDVHVVEANKTLLPRQLDEAGALLLRREIEALGVRVETGKRTRRIEGAPGGPRVLSFDDQSEITADLVVLAAGVRPRGELAGAAGLVIDPNGGVAVDDHLASSDPRIFAVGECASHRGATYGLAAPGYRMTDVLVDNLVGGSAAFAGADRSTRLKLLGVSVASLGRHDEKETPGAAAHVFAANGFYRKLVVHEGRIIGAIAVGEWEDIERVREAIAEPVRFSFWDLRRFRGTGNLWLRSESPPVHEWPAEAVVCGCTGVRRGALTEAELAGCATVAELGACTGAGTVCGSCKPLLADFLRRTRVESLPPGSSMGLRPAEPGSAPYPASSVELRGPDSAPVSTRGRRVADPISVRYPPSSRTRSPADPVSASLPAVAALRVSSPAILPPPSSEDVDTPPTLRSDGADPGEAVSFPVAPQSPADAPLSLPPPRAAFDTLMSATEAFCGPGEIPAAPRLPLLVCAPPPSSAAPSSSALPLSVPSLAPASADAPPISGPLAPPPSSRRSSMAPLRSITVPPEQRARLASLVPTSSPSGCVIVPEPPHRRAMLAAAAVAVAGSLAIALVPPVPPAPSFRGRYLDDLVAGRAARQVSGWSIVVLAALVVALSLRKRWARFGVADVPSLRLAHAAAGAAALLALAVHTGLRAGARADRLLFLDFLAVSLGGGLAAAATALARRFHPAVAEARRLAAYRVHFVLFLPLPILVALHVLRAYWYSP